MVFQEIESITDVISNHRIIIYYIEGKLSSVCTKRNDTKFLETVIEMLEKKNDDLLVVKVLHGSNHFNQFQEIYHAEVTGSVTLFVVNNEGIPLMCEQMNLAENVPDIIKILCATCKLNSVSIEDMKNISQLKTPRLPQIPKSSNLSSDDLNTSNVIPANSSNAVNSAAEVILPRLNSENTVEEIHHTTKLQIRLPNGDKDQQKFDKDAMLQEVWIFIKCKYKLENFDLKTYNHQIFSEDEYEKTLQSLDLCPSGVIIVVEKNASSYNSEGAGAVFQNSLRHIITKTTSLIQYVQELLVMFWRSFFFSNSGDRRDQQGTKRISAQDNSDTNQGRPKRSKSTKTYGNIHTLHQKDDSDDENNRYNGNSTQQK